MAKDTTPRNNTIEENLANIDKNPIKIDKSDNSSDNESKAGAQISKEVNKGTRPEDLSPIPADATEGHVEPATDYGVHIPSPDEQLGGGKKLDDPKGFKTEITPGNPLDRTDEGNPNAKDLKRPRDVNGVDLSAKGNPKVGNKKSVTKK